MNVYLDNNSTTQVGPEVWRAMEPYFSGDYANPSTLYRFGMDVRKKVEEARSHIARLLNGKSEREIIFTSGATESNNAAIRSALKLFPHKKRIVISRVEHASIKNLCEDELVKEGYEVVSISVTKSGSINWAELEQALTDEVAVVTMMWVNNETGVIFPIERIGELVKRKGIMFHVDAAQAIGKVPVHFSKTGADTISFSAHKIHGPKGIGALYVRDGADFYPFIFGGRQERDRRAGTENVPGIMGFEKATESAVETLENDGLRISKLRNRLEEGLMKRIPEAFINGILEERVGNTIHITIPGVEAEALLIRLSEAGICASSGSACLTGALEPSHVLMAMGVTEELAFRSIRFSLSRYTTDAEIDYTLEVVPKLVSELRKLERSGVDDGKPREGSQFRDPSSLRSLG